MRGQEQGKLDAQRLNTSIYELKMSLEEKLKKKDKLEESIANFKEAIDKIDEKFAVSTESFRWQKKSITNSMKMMLEESQEYLDELKIKQFLIREQISGFDVIEYENKVLNERLKQVSTFQLQTEQAHANELELKKQQDFDTR